MASVSVRYIVDDVDAAIAFYRGRLGFSEVMHPAPSFAMLTRGDLRLVLSAPGGGPGGGQAMPDGRLPEPGGWNRFSVEVSDLDRVVDELRRHRVTFRSAIVHGVGGRQVLIEDPSGNPVELFEPSRPEARLAPETEVASHPSGGEPAGTPRLFQLLPLGVVESPLRERSEAPRQGQPGAPDAWLIFRPEMAAAIRDLRAGDEVIVITWLDRSSREVLTAVPGDEPGGPERGVFSTRSPDRPNPVGLHRVRILAAEGLRIRVDHLEALNGTPVIDVKPVLHPAREG